ncbi:MAG: aldolase protein, partial [Actinobacteria bacterium]|nr:aldolase protein [Actinomycetota bacterium]
CEEKDCPIKDCWKDCDRVRLLGDTPVVSGEIGAGGLAKRVPPVIAGPRKAAVYGHGVFTVGMTGFSEAFSAMVDVENWCRGEYFRRFEAKRSG